MMSRNSSYKNIKTIHKRDEDKWKRIVNFPPQNYSSQFKIPCHILFNFKHVNLTLSWALNPEEGTYKSTSTHAPLCNILPY